MNPLVTFAVSAESAGFRNHGFADGVTPRTLHTGVGGKAAAHSLEDAIRQNRPDFIFISGFATGLDAKLEVGAIILAENTSSPGWERHLADTGAWVIPARLFSSEAVLTTAAEKLAARERTGCAIADMESEAIFAIATREGIPAMTVRAISDTADQDLGSPTDLLVKAAEGHPAPLLAYLAIHPAAWPSFRRLVRNARIARRALGGALARIVGNFSL